jgi:uncharacterized flavoprotein (TIGR03862 family)
MAAEILIQNGANVHLYDAMPSVGRKFLVAGKGGLNLTHSEAPEQFLARYGSRRAQLEPFLTAFGPDDLRAWAAELGIQTFTGTSGRIFPTGMKAAPLLYQWKQRLISSGVIFHMRNKWLGWQTDGSLRFETPDTEEHAQAIAVVLALGGASWAKLGSTGAWSDILAQAGIGLAPFKPANCGFEVSWSEHFRTKYDGQPLKSVVISFTNAQDARFQRQGEFIITPQGVEGSLIYALSAPIRDEIEISGKAILHLDLSPDWSQQRLAARLEQPRGSRSFSNHLEKATGIKGVKAGLLWEFVPKSDWADPQKLAAAIKDLQIPLNAACALDEAISTAGGVNFDELDQRLMLRKLPGVFCAGEMLDWEAPTGGYLMTGCFATGRAAGLGVLSWLHEQ